jgi:hypothetical protein
VIHRVEVRLKPPELKEGRDVRMLTSSHLNRSEAFKGIRSQVVKEKHHIEKAWEPETSLGTTGTVHDGISGALGIPNLAFSKVLMPE